MIYENESQQSFYKRRNEASQAIQDRYIQLTKTAMPWINTIINYGYPSLGVGVGLGLIGEDNYYSGGIILALSVLYGIEKAVKNGTKSDTIDTKL